jgi:hypothetical protein
MRVSKRKYLENSCRYPDYITITSHYMLISLSEIKREHNVSNKTTALISMITKTSI